MTYDYNIWNFVVNNPTINPSNYFNINFKERYSYDANLLDLYTRFEKSVGDDRWFIAMLLRNRLF